MIYPENFEKKIGFDTIRDLLAEKCISDLGRDHVQDLSFSTDFLEIQKMLDETDEFRQILGSDRNFPSQDYFDMRDELSRIRLEGTFIEQEEIFNLKTSLITLAEILFFFKKSEYELYPKLKIIAENIIIDTYISKRINQIVDDKGRIKDNASSELNDIRKQIESRQHQIDRTINKALQSAKSSGIATEDVEITIRNGRMVIPIPAQYKRKIRGFIHDESSTGQTVFIEPTEVFDTNNELRELESAERREIIKILSDFTILLRPNIDDLILSYTTLGLFDFIRAKARLANELLCIKPTVTNKNLLNWQDALHPLLFLANRSKGKKVVPLSINLDKINRILIISGPNAGGKSVCLKTVGLLQYMMQCGLLVPMKENSVMGLFRKIFIDIGDDQSLENDLSTYSSHLKNIEFFLKNSDNKTLILIDEFGVGTEPQIGGAIAEASAEALNEKKIYGVVTTHYSNLKLLANRNDGFVNGAMLFDSRKMQPLYQLKIGKPGSSFAFEIANKMGIPTNILENAMHKTGKSQLDFDQQLQQLEIEKEEVEKQQAKFRVADEFLAEMIEKYDELNQKIEDQKEKILDEAKKEAIDIIDNSNRLIEKTIREIKENLAEKERTKNVRKELVEEKEKLTNKKEFGKKNSEKRIRKVVQDEPIKVGDHIVLKDHSTSGEILEIKGNKAVVYTGSVKLSLPLENLEKIKAIKNYKRSNKSYTNIVNTLNEKLDNFKLSLDIRGKRAEEAVSEVVKYIDDAMLLSIKEVRIIHGKGDGVLRSVIRDHLSGIQEIKSLKDEHVERGGSGTTVVVLR